VTSKTNAWVAPIIVMGYLTGLQLYKLGWPISMIINCPSCCARFAVQRSTFGTGKRRATCTKCLTMLLIGPLPPSIGSAVAEKAPSDDRAQRVGKDRKSLIALPLHYIKRSQRAWGIGSLLLLTIFLVVLYVKAPLVTFNNYDDHHQSEQDQVSLPNSLKIQNLKLSWVTRDSTVELSIRGELANFSNRVSKSQDLTIILLDKDDSQLLSWDHKLPSQRIPPKQHIAFHALATAPPEEAVAATVKIKALPTQH
jgi:predicted Zn finger-like uncharacterized protein